MTIFLIIVLFLLFTNPQIVSQEVYNASYLWFSVLLPTMYPSFVILDLIETMPLTQKLSKLLFPIFKFIFNINYQKSAFIIILSFLCGAPASTKVIKNCLERNEISKNEADNLICAFSFLSLPYTLLICNSIKVSLFLFYSLLTLISCIYMQLFNKKRTITLPISFEKKKLTQTFFNSLRKNIDIVINILGILVIFRVIIKLFFKESFIFYPYLEILGGLAQNNNNSFVTLSALGFLGISIHLQIINIYSIKYSKFFISRLPFLLLGVLAFF